MRRVEMNAVNKSMNVQRFIGKQEGTYVEQFFKFRIIQHTQSSRNENSIECDKGGKKDFSRMRIWQ